MEVLRYEMTVYANEDGEMPPERVRGLFSDLERLQGTASAPLEYVEPIVGGDPRSWGLRATVTADASDGM